MSKRFAVKTELRIQWLVRNAELWAAQRHGVSQETKTALARRMHSEGLYSPATNVFDISLSYLLRAAAKRMDKGRK